MGIFDELDKKKSSTKKSSGGIFAELDKKKEKQAQVSTVSAQKEILRSQGKAVSMRDDRATPTFGGSILRGIAKPAVTLLARPAQLAASVVGLNEKQQTLKSGYLGDIETSRNAKDVLKDVGRGFELVSNAVGVNAVRNIGVNAAKQTAINVAKRAAVEGMAAGAVQGIGSGISSGKTGKELLWEAAKSTALGGVGGFALGGAGAKIFGTKAPEKIAQQAEEAANMRVFGTKTRPSVPNTGLNPTNLQKPNLAEIVPNGVDTKGSKMATFADEATSPVREVKTTTPTTTTPPQKMASFVDDTPLPPSDAVKRSKTYASQKQAFEKAAKEDPTFEGTTFEDSIKEFESLRQTDPQKLEDLATGRINQFNNLRPAAARALLANDNTISNSLKMRLAKKFVSSKSGSDLSLARQADKTSDVELLATVQDSLESKLTKTTKMARDRELKQLTAEFEKVLADTRPTRETVEQILKDITCKI